MLFFYSVGIKIYGLLVALVSPFNKKAAQWRKGRKNQINRIQKRISSWSDAPRIMIHAASYGEYEMSKPIIQALQKADPKTQFIISFFSPSGYENTQFDNDNFIKIYLPLDTISQQKKLIEAIKPDAVLFIKYDFWYNLLKVLYDKRIPYYFTSIHLNEDSYIFSKLGSTFSSLIKEANGLYCHNQIGLNILRKNGFNNGFLLGDTRIDKALKNIENPYKIEGFNKENKPTLVIGSLTSDDESMVVDFVNKHADIAYIIAPHDVEEVVLNSLKKKIDRPTSKLTENIDSERIIVDTMGDLKYIYAYADMAYVGAGFLKGPHNVLEPLVFKAMTVCGPNLDKFPMAERLRDEGILNVIQKRSAFEITIRSLLKKDRQNFELQVDDFFKSNRSNLDALIQDISQTIL